MGPSSWPITLPGAATPSRSTCTTATMRDFACWTVNCGICGRGGTHRRAWHRGGAAKAPLPRLYRHLHHGTVPHPVHPRWYGCRGQALAVGGRGGPLAAAASSSQMSMRRHFGVWRHAFIGRVRMLRCRRLGLAAGGRRAGRWAGSRWRWCRHGRWRGCRAAAPGSGLARRCWRAWPAVGRCRSGRWAARAGRWCRCRG